MSGKVKCTCGWSWNKSDSSVKDMYICHECGRDNSNNMKNGGWLDNYGEEENANDSSVSLPEGYVGEGIFNGPIFENPAVKGQFQNGGIKKQISESTNVYNKSFNKKELKNIIKDDAEKTRTGDIKNPRAEANKFEKYLPTKETVAFFKNLKNENTPAEFREALKIQHERGNPAINVGTNKGLPFHNKRNYNPFTNEINIPKSSEYSSNLENFLKEAGHAGQPLSEVIPRFLKNDIPGYIKAYTTEGDSRDNIQQYVYDNPNTVENYTHSKIEPELEQRINSSYSWPKSKEEEADFLEYTRRNLNSSKFQMGGVMPGAVGHMYARTGSPSKGPRRNQTDVTDASAQGGKKLNPHSYDEPDYSLRLNPFLSRDPEYNMFIGGIGPSYSNKDFSIGAHVVGVGNEDFRQLPADYGIRGSYNPSKNLSINAGLSKNNVGVGMTYRFENGGEIAQNGKEMQYYREGLDWQPKTISKNGGWLDGYDVAQPGTNLPSVRDLINDTMNRKIQTRKGKGKETTVTQKDNTRTVTPKEIKKLSGRQQNELAQRQSEEQANKDWVQNSMEEAYKSPLMSPGYFTPEGMAIGALQGATKMGPDLYEGNYKAAAMDALMMLPVAIPAAKTLKNIKTSVTPELREGLQTSGFSDIFKSKPKSEINWGNWNKEIPENSQLMKEYNAIEQTTKAKGSWMKNPDGSAFQGTPEQFVQQNSENFKKAFGNTKVRDPKGNIQITNHSTWDEFDEFDLNKFGQTDDGFYGKGAYFHPNTNSPKLYGDIDMNSYVNIENPMPHDNHFFFGREGKGGYWDSLKDEQVIIDDVSSLWKNKYDGYITNHANYPLNDFNSTEYITNISSNIKSATGNNGMFDMTNPNIYKAVVPGAIGLGALQQRKDGGIIKDDMGYWNPENWDSPVEIGSNEITMEDVPFDVLGISDEGDVKHMKANNPKNYKYKGKKVTEFRMARNGVNQQDQKTLQQLDQLTNFTNYNTKQPGGWLDTL
jgi:hypothetical protein